jgi:hypothetical protein
MAQVNNFDGAKTVDQRIEYELNRDATTWDKYGFYKLCKKMLPLSNVDIDGCEVLIPDTVFFAENIGDLHVFTDRNNLKINGSQVSSNVSKDPLKIRNKIFD